MFIYGPLNVMDDYVLILITTKKLKMKNMKYENMINKNIQSKNMQSKRIRLRIGRQLH